MADNRDPIDDDESAEPETIGSQKNTVPVALKAYIQACSEYGVRINSGMKKNFPPDEYYPDEYDFSRNMLGDETMKPLAKSLADVQIKNLKMPRQGIRNTGVDDLVKGIRDHPTITSLDLSGNNISSTGAKALIQYAKYNKKVVRIDVDGNKFFEVSWRLKLKDALSKDRAKGGDEEFKAAKSWLF
eukprot:GFYU01012228.1.p1 GENE.GFYU01012228.1~~GFYU01012228.1.p1  ORF type:complete len:186 (+),score=52.25 GFYU01012228.1:189-746(+)